MFSRVQGWTFSVKMCEKRSLNPTWVRSRCLIDSWDILGVILSPFSDPEQIQTKRSFFLIREPSEDQVSSSIGGGGGRLPPPIPEEQTWAQGGRSRGGRQTSHTPCRPQGGRRIILQLAMASSLPFQRVVLPRAVIPVE